MKRIFLLLLIISAFVWLTGCFSVLRTQEVTSTLVPGASSEPEFTQDASVEEIRFRGLEWGIDSAAATDFLNSDSEISQTFIADNTAIPDSDGILDPIPTDIILNAGTIVSCTGATVDGYETLEARLYFKYEANDRGVDRESDNLYLAKYFVKYINANDVYEELAKDISALYGTGAEKTWNGGGVSLGDWSGAYITSTKETTWTGKNDTFVTLRCTTSDNEEAWMSCGVWITYGKSDIADDLQELKNAINQEYAEEEASNTRNGNGL